MTFRFALQYAANHELSKLDAACTKAAFATWWDMKNYADFSDNTREFPWMTIVLTTVAKRKISIPRHRS